MHWDLQGVMLWLRVTARLSGILLAASLAAPALPRLWRSSITSWMSANRHRFTLLFALSHTLHLGGVITLASLAPARFFSKPALPGLVIGSIGYGFPPSCYFLLLTGLEKNGTVVNEISNDT
jgi:hypothetical protein